MTNQQGAPEALRPEMLDDLIETFATAGLGRHNLMRVELPRHQWAQLAVALSRLRAENARLAALVEAQLPAPSAAAAVEAEREGLRVAIRSAIQASRYHFVDPIRRDTADRVLLDLLDDINALAAAPQPSPTPQADSQPAPDLEEVLSAARNWGEVQQYNRTDGKGTEYRITFNVHQRAAHFARELLAASAPADSEVARLRAALVYTAYALHATPQYMLAEGITLIDGDTVRVSRDGWTVEASVNPARATPPAQAQAGAVPLNTSTPES